VIVKVFFVAACLSIRNRAMSGTVRFGDMYPETGTQERKSNLNWAPHYSLAGASSSIAHIDDQCKSSFSLLARRGEVDDHDLQEGANLVEPTGTGPP
jgi:hypothetical protein